MNTRIIFDRPFRKQPEILQMMLDIDAGNGPEIPGFDSERYFKRLHILIFTFPPLMVYYFSMLVKVNLTPGYLSLIPI